MSAFTDDMENLLYHRFGSGLGGDVHVESKTDETAGVLSIYVWKEVENRRHVLTVSTDFVKQYESGEILV